jgi:hypothetical protein
MPASWSIAPFEMGAGSFSREHRARCSMSITGPTPT